MSATLPAVTHKRFLWKGEYVPPCGATTGKGVSLSDEWAVVTCEKCLHCRPSDRLVNGAFLVVVGACLALFGAWGGAALGWPMALFPLASFGFFAVVFAAAGLTGMCSSVRKRWGGVEPAEPRKKCEKCGKPGSGRALITDDDEFSFNLLNICSDCEEEQRKSPPCPATTLSRARWEYLLNRADVVVLDTQTNGLDADVTDVAVIDTHGDVLLHDLRALGAKTYADVHRPLMRVLKRASIICSYNLAFDIKMIQQSAARRGLDATIEGETVCIMEEYAEHYTPDGRWPKLEEAARREYVRVGGAPHRPLTDARLTLGIMCRVVARERVARGVPSGDALGVCAVGRFSARSATTCRGYEHHDPLHIGVCFFCGADS